MPDHSVHNVVSVELIQLNGYKQTNQSIKHNGKTHIAENVKTFCAILKLNSGQGCKSLDS